MAKSKGKKKQEEKVLQQTKGTFKVLGVVNRIGRDNAYTEGEVSRGKNEGNEYRSLRFGVKSSPNNEIFVELFGMVQENAWIYKPASKEDKKKNAKAKGTTKKIDFEDRDDIEDGYTIIGVTLGIDKDEKGKQIRESLVPFDATEKIYEELEDGETVFVSGDVEYSTYESQGQVRKQTRFTIRNISKPKNDIDFDDEKFEEMCSFEQEFVFVDAELDSETNKLLVTGRVILYGNKFMDVQYVIDNEKYPKLVKNFQKRLGFGDLIKVYGNCVNRTVEEEIEEEEEDDWGGGGKPRGFGSGVTTRITEMEIVDVDGDFIKEQKENDVKFTEEDFANAQKEGSLIDNSDDDDEDDDDEDDDAWGGSGRNDEDDEEEDEDDLPF